MVSLCFRYGKFKFSYGSNSGPFAQGSDWANRFLSVDPWMSVNPSEYGNAAGVCSLLTWAQIILINGITTIIFLMIAQEQ